MNVKGTKQMAAAESSIMASDASAVLEHDADFRLEELKIKDSKELKKYIEMELPPSYFSTLKILEASKCDEELTKFLSILLRQSPGLEELTLADCKLLEQVLNLRLYLPPYDQEPHLFPNLRKMRLWDLPKLNCICKYDVKLGNLVELELVKCSFLRGPLPTTLLAKLDILRIESCEMMEQVVEEKAELQESCLFQNLRILRLLSLPKLIKFNSAHCHLTFPKLEDMVIENCPGLNAFSQALWKALFGIMMHLRLIGMPKIKFLTLPAGTYWKPRISVPNLKTMVIEDCNDLEYVFAIEGDSKQSIYLLFSDLRELHLHNLGELRSMVKKYHFGFSLSFKMLTHLTVSSCNQLRYVLPFHVLQSLRKLQNIVIIDCEMLERVFGDEEEDIEMRISSTVHPLPQVKSLILEKLPKFRGFCQDGYIVEWLSFMKVRVVKCPMIQKSSLGKIDRLLLKSVEVIDCNINTWPNPESSIDMEYLFELTDALLESEYLRVEDPEELMKCMEIMKLRPSFTRLRILVARQCEQELAKFLSILVHQSNVLEEITLENFNLLEQVLNLGDMVFHVFPQLRRLRLWNLPKLNRIYNNNVKFGNLVELQIVKCNFLKGPIPTILLEKLDFLKIESCEMIEHVVEENAGMQESLFHNLRFLQLVSLPKLIKFTSAHCILTFPKLEEVWIENCHRFNSLHQILIMASFSTLKHLKLIGVPKMLDMMLSISEGSSNFSVQNLEYEDLNDLQYLFDIESIFTEESRVCRILSSLGEIELHYLAKFRGMMKQSSLEIRLGFEMLNRLTICSCNQLMYALPLHVIQSLQKLKHIEIRDCEMLERVFGDEDNTQMSSHLHYLPWMCNIIFEELPKFRGFCQDGSTMEWSVLEKVRIVKCNMIEKSSLGKIDGPDRVSAEVIECNRWASNEDIGSSIEYLFDFTSEEGRRYVQEEGGRWTKEKIVWALKDPKRTKEDLKQIKHILEREEYLYLEETSGMSNVLGEFNRKGFYRLRKLHIQNNTNIRYIARISRGDSRHVCFFPELRTMILENLSGLDAICPDEIIISAGLNIFLGNIEVIKVKSCSRLKYLFHALAIANNLGNVDVIMEVSDCQSMTHILYSDYIPHVSLRSLTLQNLSELKAFSELYNPVHALFPTAETAPPKLRHLKLAGIRKIICLVCWYPNDWPHVPLQLLETMEIAECNGLEYLFIQENKYIEDEDVKSLKGLLCDLAQLCLRDLNNFKSIVGPNNHLRRLKFKMLTHLTVCGCKQLKHLLPRYVLEDLQLLKFIDISD